MEYAINTRISSKVNSTDTLNALTMGIRKYATMTPEEEVAAFNALASASTESERIAIRNSIVNANLRFALSIARKYSSDGDKVAELVSLAAIGLSRAVDNFDVTKGFKFISHAVHWIRAEFNNFFATDANLVCRSNNRKVGTKDKRIIEKFLQTEQREPSEDEILEALESEYGLVLKNKVDVVAVRTNFISERINGEDESTAEESGEFATATASRNDYERTAEIEDAQYRAKQLLEGLSVREQEIVCRRFGIGYEREQELDEIADAIGCTNENVRILLAKSLSKMKGRAKFLSALVG